MAFRPAATALAAATLAGATYVGFTPLRGGPALGGFLDPVHGVWATASRAALPAVQQARLPSLGSSVEVRYDDRSVPHIFARNSDDAFRALGWVHARDRLFQMELQMRAVAGTLSEMLGTRTLAIDREARALGLAWGAERSFRAIDPDSPSAHAMRAYAEGVNAYLDDMVAADTPFEYRLLNVTPMRWKSEYAAFLQARMGLTLAFSDGELRRERLEALVGEAAAGALYPEHAPIQEPLQPNGRRSPRFDWTNLPAPLPVDSVRLAAALETERTLPQFAALPRDAGEISVGSNNWAVAPRRTAAGYALLAGDPHLSLSLPSIWYEVHMSVPDSLDVYGVTIPGAPFVAIGFNRDVAWSMTNTGADVADYYVEQVDDPARPTRYRLDGAWKPLALRIETVRGRHGELLATDTIRHTHRGPMTHAGARWISHRWTVAEPSDDIRAFRGASAARSSAELLASMADFFAPAQNIITADRAGHIGIRSTGHFPFRPASTSKKGDVLVDGSSGANDWQGWWPLREYPQAFDPDQGFLASANQQPKDPKLDPTYLGWDWPAPWRAMRINTLLRADSAVTPDAMRRFQTDPLSEEVPIFLGAFLRAAASAPSPRDSALVRAERILAGWDGTFTKENESAVLFDAALDELARRTWDELEIPGSFAGAARKVVAPPNSMILAQLLQDPQSAWWDSRSTTSRREDRDAVLRSSLAGAYVRVVKARGEPGVAWRWEHVRHTNIHHMLRLPALSRLDIPMQSGAGTLSPSSGDGSHGASWRMVVELGPEVRAWGTYPGGQSGNPVSARYDDRLTKWAAGELDTLRFPREPDELSGRTLTSILTLAPATAR